MSNEICEAPRAPLAYLQTNLPVYFIPRELGLLSLKENQFWRIWQQCPLPMGSVWGFQHLPMMGRWVNICVLKQSVQPGIKNIFSLWGQLGSETSCPERLCSLHLCGFWRSCWIKLQITQLYLITLLSTGGRTKWCPSSLSYPVILCFYISELFILLFEEIIFVNPMSYESLWIMSDTGRN